MLVSFLAVGANPAVADKPAVFKNNYASSYSFVFDCGVYDPAWSEVLVSANEVYTVDIYYFKDGSVYRNNWSYTNERTWENLVTGTTATGVSHSSGTADAEAVASGYVSGRIVQRGEVFRMQRDDHAMFQEAGWELIIDGTWVDFHGTEDLTYYDFCVFMN